MPYITSRISDYYRYTFAGHLARVGFEDSRYQKLKVVCTLHRMFGNTS
jgi:hypothetical protein